MNATWFEALPTVLVAAAWIMLPGAALLYSIGVRGFVAWSVAPAISMAAIASLGVVFSWFTITWTPIAVLAAIVVAAALLWLVRLAINRVRSGRGADQPASTSASDVGARRNILLAWCVAGVLCVIPFVFALGAPAAISQTFDNGFHLNAVQHILDTADASSFTLTSVIGAGGTYPAAWHDVVSVVAATTGASIPISANAVNLVITAVVWPGAVMLLARLLFGARPAVVYSAAIISASLPWFPLLMLTFGVLYPFFMAMALLPLALALEFSLLGFGRRLGLSAPVRVAMLIGVWAAMALAQPAIVFAAVAFVVPAAIWATVRFATGTAARAVKIAVVLAAALGVVAFGAAWVIVGRMGVNAPWEPLVGPRSGALQVILLFRDGGPPAFVLAALVVIGIVAAIVQRRHLWLVGTWAVGAVLFFIADAIQNPTVRGLALGLFYKDPPRLAALFAIACLPIAIAGSIAVWRLIRRARDRAERPRPIRLVLGGIFVVVLLAGSQGFAMREAHSAAATAFRMTDDAPILAFDERVLIERILDSTGGEGVIAGNAWTGTNLAYALTGQRVLNPHFNSPTSQEQLLINEHLNDVAGDPEICAALRSLDVRWVLDFGDRVRDVAGVLAVDSSRGFGGMTHLDTAPGFEEIDREGDAVLYRITACD